MGNLGSFWSPTGDVTLKNLQSQLEAQLKQREAEIEARQDFQRFTGGKISEFLQEQGEARLGAISNYKTVLRQNYIDKINTMKAMSTGRAQEIIEGLEGDPARQVAVGTIQEAAMGGDIARVSEHGEVAASARGMATLDLSDLSEDLSTSAQEVAAPLAFQMEMENILRPFELQAREAQTMNVVSQTSAAGTEAQARSLASLMEYEAGPVNVLSSLFGQYSGAYMPPGVSEDVAAARFGTYGYQSPIPEIF